MKTTFPDEYKDILWEINQPALEKQITDKVDFDDIEKELSAIEAVRTGDWESVMELLAGDRAHMHEAELLFNAGYDYAIDPVTNMLHLTNR